MTLAAASVLVFTLLIRPAAAQSVPQRSPGAIALLATEGPTAELRRALEGGIRDADPKARATAARVAWAVKLDDFSEIIASALATETDSLAATEEIRALLFMRSAAAISDVETALPRAGSAGMLVFAEWLARMEPDRFATEVGKLRLESEQDAVAVAAIVRMAARQHPGLRESFFRAWMKAAPEAGWRAFLEDRRRIPQPMSRLLSHAVHQRPRSVRKTVGGGAGPRGASRH